MKKNILLIFALAISSMVSAQDSLLSREAYEYTKVLVPYCTHYDITYEIDSDHVATTPLTEKQQQQRVAEAAAYYQPNFQQYATDILYSSLRIAMTDEDILELRPGNGEFDTIPTKAQTEHLFSSLKFKEEALQLVIDALKSNEDLPEPSCSEAFRTAYDKVKDEPFQFVSSFYVLKIELPTFSKKREGVTINQLKDVQAFGRRNMHRALLTTFLKHYTEEELVKISQSTFSTNYIDYDKVQDMWDGFCFFVYNMVNTFDVLEAIIDYGKSQWPNVRGNIVFSFGFHFSNERVIQTEREQLAEHQSLKEIKFDNSVPHYDNRYNPMVPFTSRSAYFDSNNQSIGFHVYFK